MRPPRAVLAALAAIAVLLAGCTGGVSDPTVVAWENALAAHGTPGLSATMTAEGDDLVLAGAATLARTEAPFALEPAGVFPDMRRLAYFEGRVLGEGAGLIVLEGTSLSFSAGQLRDVGVGEVNARSDGWGLTLATDSARMKPTVTFPTSLEPEGRAFFFADTVPLSGLGLTVSGQTAAWFVRDGNASALPDGFAFDADALYWDDTSTMHVQALTITFADFALTGDPLNAIVRPGGNAAITDAKAVFGHDATLALGDGTVATSTPFWLTQAITPDGLALDAKVDLHSAGDRVEVKAGEVGWYGINYRERSYSGAAVLERATVSGAGASMVSVPLEHPPLIIEQVWDALPDEPWAAGFAAIAIAAASPGIILIDITLAVLCAFSTCPEQYPYPMWMEPGEIGLFYVKVDATMPPGSYPVEVTLHGQNHEPVKQRFTVEVV